MTTADASTPAITPHPPLVDVGLKKQSRLAAIGYAVLSLYYVAILLFTVARIPWASFDQFTNEVSSRSDSVGALAIFAIVAMLLAACAFKLFSIHRVAFWCVVLASTTLALCFLTVFVFSVVIWRSPEAGSVGWWTIAISTAQLLIYVFCAFLLLRLGLVTHRRRKKARMLAMGPLPTTSL